MHHTARARLRWLELTMVLVTLGLVLWAGH